MLVLVTINYNDFKSTSNFVYSIAQYDAIDRIVIVDNHSVDDSFKKLMELSSEKIHVIQTKENLGYAKGNNFGINYATSKWDVDYLAISNPDVYFTEKTLINVIETMKCDSQIAICTAIMKNQTGRAFTNFSSRLPKYSDLLLSCFQGIVQFRNKVLKKSEYTPVEDIKNLDVFYTDVVPGSFFVADRYKFEEIGYFDERTFLYYEENIIAYKLKEKKYKEAILPKESYNHFHSVSIDKNIKKKLTLNRIMLNSSLVYLEIIKTSSLKIAIYKILYWMGFPERCLFSKVARLIRK